MQDKNCFAFTVSLAIIFLSVFFTKSIRAAPPQHESMLGSGSSGIQLAQSDPTLEPPQPEKPHPTTGVSGLRPEKPPTMTGPTLYSRGLPPIPRGLGSATERRIALVIGNSTYKVGPLKNPVNDAHLIAATLRSVGFKVIERTDADQKEMKRALQKFGDRLEEAGKDGVGLFYYAGHGVQANGRNYLIPLGAEIQRESDLDIEALRANAVLSTMDYARNRLNFVIMDACRNNPYARSFRSASRGLARMEAPRGTLVAYATGPGDVAADGKGDNSPYTEALVKAMQEPGVPVEQMFKQVRLLVEKATGSKQTPWEESSLTGDFYFNPVSLPPGPKKPTSTTSTVGAQTSAERKAPPAVIPLSQPLVAAQKEMMFWQSIQGSENPEDFEAYLKKYADGEFAVLATNRIKKLRPPIVSLAVHADKKELEVNQRIALTIRGKDSDGREVEIRQGVEWESTDERIVSVDSRGQVEAQKEGSADIIARYKELASLPLTFTVRDRIQDHLKIAKFYRERGEYSDAISELKKARSVDPENKQVLAELKKTRKACNAEKRIGRKGLEC